MKMQLKRLIQICENWRDTRDKEIRGKLKELMQNELSKIVNHDYDIEDIEVLRNEEIGVKFSTIYKHTNEKNKGWIKYYGSVKSYCLYINNITIKIED